MSAPASLAQTAQDDPHRTGAHDSDGQRADTTGQGQGGPASKRVTVAYGFWIFLLSDIVMFSAFFAAYAVLAGQTADGPRGKELFDLSRVAAQTTLLLLSSYACGLSALASERDQIGATQAWLLITGLLGAAFLALEFQEFSQMIVRGAAPTRSAFLSAFFALVGLHGVHVSLGLLWLGTMVAQVAVKGLRSDIRRRLLCFTLFWHALDIVWVAIFTLVYMFGSRL
ncbi:MAG TPA: cytochrome o ubiquinol oxidase subunit III [Caulobacter sp.]|nr:cytochrome o ubiquinol oxidase subunit III [Caulobacter sp.]